MPGLTKEQIEQEKKLMEGVPGLNIGALFLPAIWGPAHGLWISILFYPLWLLADNVLYAAYSAPTTLSVILAALVFIGLAAITVVFSRLGQPYAARRALGRTMTKQEYLRRQRIWAVACVAGACVLIGLATYYNVALRPAFSG